MKSLLVIGFLLVGFYGFSQPFPNCCNEYTSVGTSNAGVNPGTCATPGQVSGGGCGTAVWTGTGCAGFITSTVVGPPTACLTLSYTAVNQDDYGTITTDTGGALTITGVNTNVAGNVVGPFVCGGQFVGSVQITICSTIPFNSVTLTNTGCTSGWVINCATQVACGGSCGVTCDAGWTPPTACSTDPPINLDALITGDSGGTWSGTGVTGNMFDPSGGTQTITYTAPGACDSIAQIVVTTSGVATWTPPVSICDTDPPLDLNTLVTGTPGGTWSGTGVTGNMFDPSGLSGPIACTYDVGTVPCDDSNTQNITVITSSSAAWTAPASMCDSDPPLDLNTLITGTTGGTWSGTGVTGNMFDPSGLSGPINITYDVGTVPCDDSNMQTITVVSNPSAAWTVPTGVCDSDAPIDLDALITGTNGGAWTGTGVTGNMFDPSNGTQLITYTIGSGACQDVSAQTITVGVGGNPAWTTFTMCASDAPVNLNNFITGDPGGTWSGTGVSGTVFDPFFGTQSVTYSVGDPGCEQTSTQTITVVDPVLTITSTNVTCFGLADGTMTVNVTGGSGTYTYNWSTNPAQTTQTATNVPAGSYTVTVVDGTCTEMDTVTIIEPDSISLVMTAVNGCEPSLGSATVLATGGVGGFTYAWTPSGQTSATAAALDSAMHTVVVTDNNGCTNTDSILVQIFPPPFISVTQDTTIEYENEVQLNASGGSTYSWSPPTGLDCDDCPNPLASPLQDTYYCVSGTDANGCINDTCMTVKVIIICGDVFVPSGFSPNDDGENDLLCVYSDCMEQMTFTIYNRWGEPVFQTNDMNICWDGTWKGKPLNSAVFVYTLDGYLINGELVDQKGNISLIR